MTSADIVFVEQECSCGHRRMFHDLLTGQCRSATRLQDFRDLPEPEYTPGGSTFEWPINWPPRADIPRAYFPCDCTEFEEPPPVPGPDGI